MLEKLDFAGVIKLLDEVMISPVTITAFPCPFLVKPLSHILVYLFYFRPSFCPSWDRSIINKESYG